MASVRELATKYGLTRQGIIFHLKYLGAEKDSSGKYIILPEHELYIKSRIGQQGGREGTEVYQLQIESENNKMKQINATTQEKAQLKALTYILSGGKARLYKDSTLICTITVE